jgi:hypothetical protein
VQVEIDEYRDYDKALGALKESRKFMLKAEQDCTVLDRRIEMVDIFVRAKAMVKTEPDQFLKICHDLLNQPKLDAAVQVPRAAATCPVSTGGRDETCPVSTGGGGGAVQVPRAAATTTRSRANRTGHAHARGAGRSMPSRTVGVSVGGKVGGGRLTVSPL